MSSPMAQRTDSAKSLLQSFQSVAMAAVATAGKLTQQAGQTMWAASDAVGLKDKVEAAEKAARKVAARGRVDAGRAVSKAKRMAARVLDFEEEDDFVDSADFDNLLSNIGAIEKFIPMHGSYSQTFAIPAGQSLVWKARVKRNDIASCVKELREGEPPLEIQPLQKYKSDTQMQGHITASSRPRSITLVFDNSHSLQVKTIVFWVAIGENVTLSDDTANKAKSKEYVCAEEGPSE